jgi:hypothetical protein
MRAIRIPGPDDERPNRIRIPSKAYRVIHRGTSNEKRMEINMVDKEKIKQEIQMQLEKTGGGYYTLKYIAKIELEFWSIITITKDDGPRFEKVVKDKIEYYQTYIEIIKEMENAK